VARHKLFFVINLFLFDALNMKIVNKNSYAVFNESLNFSFTTIRSLNITRKF